MKKRLLALALTLCMMLSLLSAMTIASAAANTTLDKLTPMAQRTYNSLSDPDDKPYGYGGPKLASWESNDKSNVGTTYSNGLKYSTTGSWSIARFAVDYYVNKGYGSFTGSFVLHENVKSSTTGYYVRIIGDGNTLYTSNIMQVGTLPQAFSVDISNVTVLTIEAKCASGSSFYNYDCLGVVDTALTSGGSSTTPPPSGGSTTPPEQTPPPSGGAPGNPVGTGFALERFTPLAQRTYNSLSDTDDKVYGYGGPKLSNWEPNDLSNVGGGYSSGVKYSTTGSWSIDRFATDYYLNGLCNTFTGSLVLHENVKNFTTNYYVRILADGNTLYTSQLMQTGVLPQAFSVDVSGVTVLTIEAKCVQGKSFYNYDSLGVVDAKLYSTSSDPTTAHTAAKTSGKQLGDLTPLAIRTYNGLSDPDDKVYGYGGRDPQTWGPSQKANTNGTYDGGVLYTTGGSWSIARFAYDYYVNRQYKNFSGEFVLSQDAKNYTTSYYIRILGDGNTLYTSKLMQPGTLPQAFSVDVSNVTTLTIEGKCVQGKSFYNYAGLGVVNAMLGGGTGSTTPPAVTPTPTPGGSPNPSDPSAGSGSSSWAQGEVGQAIALGFVPGELQYNYQQNITRQEFCKLIVNMLMGKSSTLNSQDAFIRAYNIDLNAEPFSDTSDQYVKIAYSLQIVNGTGSGKFSPGNSITRQEAASMLQRAAAVFQFTEYKGSAGVFSDKGSVASWASAAVDFVSANGIMGGSGGAFTPHGYYSREQSILTALRLFNAFPRASYAV